MNRSTEAPTAIIGRRVRHPDYGYGVVLRVRYGGLHSQVLFHNGMRMWVRTIDLESVEAPTQADDAWTPPGDRVQVLQILEALRLGVVPRDDVPHLTFGRDESIARVRSALADVAAGGACLLIEGPYGSGKTHFLEYIAHLALQEGFGVARAELDPLEVTPYKPKRVYRSFLESLTVLRPDGSSGTWTDLLADAVGQDLVLDPPHVYLTRALRALRRDWTSERADLVRAWLAGEMYSRADLNASRMSQWPTWVDHSTAADHLCYLLSGWSTLVRALGYRGLVLLVDEAETVGHAGLRLERSRGFNTLKGLVALAQNRPGTDQLSRLTWDKSDQAYKDAYGFVHSGVRPLPYAYRRPTYIGLFIAATPVFPGTEEDWRAMIPAADRLVLWPLLDDDFRRMTLYIVRLFRAAYPDVPVTDADAETIGYFLRRRLNWDAGPPHPRVFLKALAELLLLRRRYPSEPWSRLVEPPEGPMLLQIQ
jgi:hypothetical protein